MSHIEQVFNHETLQLDGESYDECEFNHCALIYCGGSLPNAQRCRFNNCQFVIDGAAMNTLLFLAQLCQIKNGGDTLVETLFTQIRSGAFRQAGQEVPVSLTSRTLN